MIPVLGAFASAACRNEVIRVIGEWASGHPTVRIVVVAHSENWSADDFASDVQFTRPPERAVVDAILVQVARPLGLVDGRAVLFISHSGDDPDATDEAQGIIAQARNDATARRFFGRIVDSIDADRDRTIVASKNGIAIHIPPAYGAMRDGLRIRRMAFGDGDGIFESLLYIPVVGGEIRKAINLRFERLTGRNHVHPLRGDTLNGGHQI